MSEPEFQEPEPPSRGPILRIGRLIVGLSTAGIVLLAGSVVCLLATFYAVSFGWSLFAPGGPFSELQVGDTAPPIVLPTLEGETIDLDDLRGSPVALNFWTTWCAACVLEVPRFNRALVDHADVGLRVLGVNVNEPNEDVRKFVDKNDVDFTVVLDGGGGFFKRFRVKTLPTTVWIDRDGVIRAIHKGSMSGAEIDQYVRRLDEPADDYSRPNMNE